MDSLSQHLRTFFPSIQSIIYFSFSCARVVERVVETLRQAGHQMVHFPIPEPHRAGLIILFSNFNIFSYFKPVFFSVASTPTVENYSENALPKIQWTNT